MLLEKEQFDKQPELILVPSQSSFHKLEKDAIKNRIQDVK
jgi:hypothetical protein